MTTKEFKANIKYLEDNGVSVSNNPTWESFPHSRELYFNTPSGGDFSICVEELSREKVLDNLDSFDINEETVLWWGEGNHPFSNVKQLYEDIEQWVENFTKIAENMPY